MSDHHRIYLVHDVEAPLRPTAPLVPRNASKSDMGDPLDYPPLPQCTIPLMHSKPPKKRSRCCKFLCWTFSMLLILIIATAITIGVLYHAMDKLIITQFNVFNNTSLYVTFNVTITARNPNKKIGMYHEVGSHISSWYMDTQLREGSLQKFYQGHRNTTVLNFPLTGQTQDATGLENKVQQKLHQTNNIPFNPKVKQPVRIKLGKLKLFEVNLRVRCMLVLDSLGANNDIRIASNSCVMDTHFRPISRVQPLKAHI
ncbi:NDR1/HIN1-like protein 6 [Gastrolobium bilobum]|uniref:NDR1/HIN1-like protein 6 n=1 Tax=Gastrolobium bilobum TaxID=150636 RepID=UPI002AB26F13|nr:NDR1/HIN1-like protein 6 [Gastrolobium bilobum]